MVETTNRVTRPLLGLVLVVALSAVTVPVAADGSTPGPAGDHSAQPAADATAPTPGAAATDTGDGLERTTVGGGSATLEYDGLGSLVTGLLLFAGLVAGTVTALAYLVGSLLEGDN